MALAFNRFGAESQILRIWTILSKTLQFQFLGSYLDPLSGQMVFSIKILVYWSEISCKTAIFGTIFRLRNWFGNCNYNCHFTTEISMCVQSNLYMRCKKVPIYCLFYFFSKNSRKISKKLLNAQIYHGVSVT